MGLEGRAQKMTDEQEAACSYSSRTREREGWGEGEGEGEEEEGDGRIGGKKQVCRYGKTCYRKNPQHFEEFAHPWLGRVCVCNRQHLNCFMSLFWSQTRINLQQQSD